MREPASAGGRWETCTSCTAGEKTRQTKGKVSNYAGHGNIWGWHQAFVADGSPAARPRVTFRAS